MDQHASSHLRGIGFAIGGFTFWVVIDALMKISAEAHLAPNQIVGIMGLTTIIVMLLKTNNRHAFKVLWPKNIKAQVILAFLSISTNYTNVIALRHLPFTIFYVAVFTAPMMIALLSAFFLKERLGWLKFLTIVIGFAGVIIAINPFNANLSNGDLIGYAAAFASSICFAVNVTLTRKLTQSENTDSLVFFNGLMQVAVSGIIAVFFKTADNIPSLMIFILVMAGILSVGGNYMMTLAVKYAPAATVAPFHYTQIITGTLVAFLVWHEIPKFHFWIGVVIIVATGIYIVRSARRQQIAEIAPH